MPLGLWFFLGWMLFVVTTGVGLLIWGWRNGQFRDVEDVKYRMLEEREPAPWPERRKGKSSQPEDSERG